MDIEIVPDFRALGHDRSLHAGEIDEGCDPDLRSLRDLFRRDLPTPRPPKNGSTVAVNVLADDCLTTAPFR